MDCGKLKKRLENLKTERSNIQGILELIENYVVPFRARFYDDTMEEAAINWRRRSLYDSTAVDANQNLSSNLHSGLTNSAYRWFTLVFRDKKLMKIKEAIDWLEQCSDRMFLSIQESNFDLEVNETFLDLTSFGTATLTEEIEETNNKFKQLVFSAIPLSQAYFEFDYMGRVIYFYRELYWTATQIRSKFGDITYPPKIQKALESDTSATEKFKVIFAIYPRMDKQNVGISKVIAPEERPFGCKYFSETDEEQIGEESGYYEMPAFVPRWRKTAGSSYGHSPAMVVLSDILTLNQLVELILVANEKAVDPAILTTRRGVFGDIDLSASGVTTVASLDSIKAFESTARFDVSNLTKEGLQESIRKAFYEDQLQLKESPQMTATEVQTRFELMARLIGPSLGRIQNDLHAPLVSRTFNGLYRLGQLPEPPESVREANAQVDVEFIGPMARAQKLDKVANIERWVANLAALSEAIPDILDNVDGDAAAQESGRYLSVPAEVINSTAKIKTIRDKRAKQIEAQQRLALAEQGSKIVKNMGGGGNGTGQEAFGAAGEQPPA